MNMHHGIVMIWNSGLKEKVYNEVILMVRPEENSLFFVVLTSQTYSIFPVNKHLNKSEEYFFKSNISFLFSLAVFLY